MCITLLEDGTLSRLEVLTLAHDDDDDARSVVCGKLIDSDDSVLVTLRVPVPPMTMDAHYKVTKT